MERERVREFIKKEVSDWDDDEAVATARFKAFSGQRSDWEPKYQFWKNLILNVARHLRLVIVRPHDIRNIWFNRGGLTPLCLDEVLVRLFTSLLLVYIFFFTYQYYQFHFSFM